MLAKRLVLAGGGHAHLMTLSRLADFAAAGIEVVCVAPGPYLAYSGMGPGLLAGRYTLAELRFPIAAMAARHGAHFERGHIAAIDPAGRRLLLRDGRSLGYDAVSFGLGSRVVPDFSLSDTPGATALPVKPIENLLLARQAVESRVEAGGTVRVVVAGGGAAGFEVAANVLGLFHRLGVAAPHLTVAAPRGLLPGWPDRAVRLAGRSLEDRGARVVAARVVGLDKGTASLSDGARIGCDLLLAATGTRPPGLFTDCGLSADPDGGLTVSACLQSPFAPEIFGGGDCIHFGPAPLPRAGVYAVRQGPVLAANLLAYLTGRELTPFRDTGKNYLALLNCGDGRAILRKGPFVTEGAWVMDLKDYIDRKFLRRLSPEQPLPTSTLVTKSVRTAG